MIQRVQSVWLLLAGLVLFLLLILPILTHQSTAGEQILQSGGMYLKANGVTEKVESFPLLFGIDLFTAVTAVATIFLFKHRTLQKRFIVLLIVLIIALAALCGSYATRLSGGMAGASLSAGAGLPLLAILFCALAFRGIRKDEQLIRSADRLR